MVLYVKRLMIRVRIALVENSLDKIANIIVLMAC